MRPLILGGALALVLAGAANAQRTDHSTHSGAASMPTASNGPALPTPDYITAAGQSDQFEIQEGDLAMKMGKNPAVKNFGRMMVTEHKKTTDALMFAVQGAGAGTATPPALRSDQTAMMDELRAAQGDAFDRLYVSQQLAAHNEALQVHTSYAANGDDPKLKAAAKKTAPIVQSHINTLNKMQASMGG